VVGLAAQAVGLVHLHDGVRKLAQVHADGLGLVHQLGQQLRGGGAGLESALLQPQLPLARALELVAQVLQLGVALLHVDDLLSSLGSKTETCN
jgi:hypothetical protein